jgi:hypothetical protein
MHALRVSFAALAVVAGSLIGANLVANRTMTAEQVAQARQAQVLEATKVAKAELHALTRELDAVQHEIDRAVIAAPEVAGALPEQLIQLRLASKRRALTARLRSVERSKACPRIEPCMMTAPGCLQHR